MTNIILSISKQRSQFQIKYCLKEEQINHFHKSNRTIQMDKQNKIPMIQLNRQKSNQCSPLICQKPTINHLLTNQKDTKKPVNSLSSVKLNQKIQKNSIELLRHEHYSFCLLSREDKQQALKLICQQFADQQPIFNAFYKKNVEIQQETYDLYIDGWTNLVENLIDNGLCVGIFDLNNGGELVGVNIGKNFTKTELFPDFNEKYLQNYNYLSAATAYEDALLEGIEQKYKYILQMKTKTMQIYVLALRKNHRGKHLLCKMIEISENLAKKHNYDQLFVFASHFKTSFALKKLNFDKIAQKSCKQFQFCNTQPFSQMQLSQSCPSLWIKRFS